MKTKLDTAELIETLEQIRGLDAASIHLFQEEAAYLLECVRLRQQVDAMHEDTEEMAAMDAAIAREEENERLRVAFDELLEAGAAIDCLPMLRAMKGDK